MIGRHISSSFSITDRHFKIVLYWYRIDAHFYVFILTEEEEIEMF